MDAEDQQEERLGDGDDLERDDDGDVKIQDNDDGTSADTKDAADPEEMRRRIVDVERGSNRVWLVKLPSFLMDYWKQVPPRVNLGSICIGDSDSSTGVAPVSLSVIGGLTKNETGEAPSVPENYTVRFTSNPPGNMLVFTEDGEGHGVGIEGTVQHECNIVPIVDEDYRFIMRQRREEAEKPKRTTQYFEHSGKNRILENVHGKFFATSNPTAAPKRRKMEDIRKDRLPREEVIEMIFKAYETHPHWSLKGMTEHLKQPTTYVKELLGDVCTYIQRGPYKATYQLKDEYRSAAHREGPAS